MISHQVVRQEVALLILAPLLFLCFHQHRFHFHHWFESPSECGKAVKVY